MQLSRKHVAEQRKVGKKGGRDVYHVATTGGLHFFAAMKSGGDLETLSVGPHVAVARFIARRDHQDLELDEMAKAEEPSVRAMAHQIPVAERMTQEARRQERSCRG